MHSVLNNYFLRLLELFSYVELVICIINRWGAAPLESRIEKRFENVYNRGPLSSLLPSGGGCHLGFFLLSLSKNALAASVEWQIEKWNILAVNSLEGSVVTPAECYNSTCRSVKQCVHSDMWLKALIFMAINCSVAQNPIARRLSATMRRWQNVYRHSARLSYSELLWDLLMCANSNLLLRIPESSKSVQLLARQICVFA